MQRCRPRNSRIGWACAPSTIYRELRRNFLEERMRPHLNGHHALVAQEVYEEGRALHRDLFRHSAKKTAVKAARKRPARHYLGPSNGGRGPVNQRRHGPPMGSTHQEGTQEICKRRRGREWRPRTISADRSEYEVIFPEVSQVDRLQDQLVASFTTIQLGQIDDGRPALILRCPKNRRQIGIVSR